MSTTTPLPQLPPPPATLNALATSATYSSGGHSHSWIQSVQASILITILILSITVIVSVFLWFILRHLNSCCIRHLTSSTSLSSNRRVSLEISPAFSIIDSLPLFTFSSVTRRSSAGVTAASASDGGDCAVCLSKFEQHDQLRLLPMCCHVFHAQCIDTWLRTNQTCPLCRSSIQVPEAAVMKSLLASTISNGGDGGRGGGSFRLEIGSISRRRGPTLDSIESSRSYSIGSFDYIVEGESEITVNQMHRRSVSNKEDNASPPDTADPEPSLVSEVASGRSWLKDYVDRFSNSLSSRTLSFRSSGRFFTGSSRRSEVAGAMEWDMEANRAGEEISELFRWLSGV